LLATPIVAVIVAASTASAFEFKNATMRLARSGPSMLSRASRRGLAVVFADFVAFVAVAVFVFFVAY
jgi:hypothetical protein